MAADRENFIFFLCPLDGVRFIAPELLILLLGKPHTPFTSESKILPELFRKALAFIRFDDYNYTVIL